jgi:ribosomal protein S18 acetylase RimI-like enzyme
MAASASRVTEPGVLVTLAEAVGERSIGTPEAVRFLADPDAVAVGGFADGTPAGYVIAYLVTRIDGDPMLIVYDVAVAAHARRRGVGAAMIHRALRIARDAGTAKAWVPTDRDNDAAIALFRSTGAEASGGDDLVMWWRLG